MGEVSKSFIVCIIDISDEKFELLTSTINSRQHSHGATDQPNTPEKRFTEPARVWVTTQVSYDENGDVSPFGQVFLVL